MRYLQDVFVHIYPHNSLHLVSQHELDAVNENKPMVENEKNLTVMESISI